MHRVRHVWKVLFLLLCGVAFSSSALAGARFCPKPKVVKASAKKIVTTLTRELRWAAKRSDVKALAKAIRRVLWISQGRATKKVSSRRLRRRLAKLGRSLKRTPNKPFTTFHPRRLLMYGLVRLQGRSLQKAERHCMDHDTHNVFRFVQSAFRVADTQGKACRGVLFTELRRKILFSDLHYPIPTPFRRVLLQIDGQDVHLFVWRNAQETTIKALAQNDEFRYKLLVARKKIKASAASWKVRRSLFVKHKALITAEIEHIQRKMKDIRTLIGSYVLIPKFKGRAAHFGYIQLAKFSSSLVQGVLNSGLGRSVLLNTHNANMRYLTRK